MSDTIPFSSETTTPVRRGVIGLIGSALAYLAVAVSCLVAGISSIPSAGSLDESQLFEFFSFLLFLLAVYTNRVVLYEHANVSACREKKDISGRLYLLGLAIPATLIFVNAVWTSLYFTLNAERSSRSAVVALRIAPAVLPFFLIVVWRTWDWPNRDSRFSFLQKNFFPAIATCSISFVFGRSVVMGSFSAVFVLSIAIVVSWIVSLLSPRTFAILGCVFLISILLLNAFAAPLGILGSAALLLESVTWALLMTLGMGIAESWKVTRRTAAGIEYVPASLADSVTRGITHFYNSGTRIATSVFLPLFLMTMLFSTTTPRYLVFFAVFLTGQFVLWIVWGNRWSVRVWHCIAMVCGFAFPILVALGTSRTPSSFASLDLPMGNSFPVALTLIALGGVAVKSLESKFEVGRGGLKSQTQFTSRN